jgi:hypothetical protein
MTICWRDSDSTIAMFLFYVISPVIVGTLFSGTLSLQIWVFS